MNSEQLSVVHLEGEEEPVRCAGFPRCSNWRGEEGVEEPVRCAGFPRCSNWRGVEGVE